MPTRYVNSSDPFKVGDLVKLDEPKAGMEFAVIVQILHNSELGHVDDLFICCTEEIPQAKSYLTSELRRDVMYVRSLSKEELLTHPVDLVRRMALQVGTYHDVV